MSFPEFKLKKILSNAHTFKKKYLEEGGLKRGTLKKWTSNTRRPQKLSHWWLLFSDLELNSGGAAMSISLLPTAPALESLLPKTSLLKQGLTKAGLFKKTSLDFSDFAFIFKLIGEQFLEQFLPSSIKLFVSSLQVKCPVDNLTALHIQLEMTNKEREQWTHQLFVKGRLSLPLVFSVYTPDHKRLCEATLTCELHYNKKYLGDSRATN